MTEDMAIPLTAAWACRLLYSSKDLAGLQDFHLHLVGAAHFEFTHVSEALAQGGCLQLPAASLALMQPRDGGWGNRLSRWASPYADLSVTILAMLGLLQHKTSATGPDAKYR
jgi:hypothetical protein